MERGRIVLAYERAGKALCLVDQQNGYTALVYRDNGRVRSLGLYDDQETAVQDFHAHAGNLRMLGCLNVTG